MTDPLASAWDFQEEASAARDEQSCAAGHPAVELALVRAARRSSLRRFYPFTRHYELCFSTGPGWYVGEGEVLSVGLAPTPDGGYLVYRRDYSTADSVCAEILRTRSAEAAVARVELLVAGSW